MTGRLSLVFLDGPPEEKPMTNPQNSSSYLMNVALRPDAVMVRGEGSFLWDSSGKRYLDFIQGWAVNALGHAPPELVDKLREQATLLFTPSPAFHNAPQLELAKRLCELCEMRAVFFCNSGAEANEGAIKLARKWGRLHKRGAFEILTTHDAFHGRTLATMAASGKAGWDRLFPPNMPGFRKVPYGDAQAMAAAITPETVAIMVEPVQGEAGVVVPPAGYLRELRSLADRHDLLLILDEVQTGIGRTGRFLAQEHEAVRGDIVTLGKGLGGGVPISALLANERSNCFSPGDQGGTYAGNPLMTAVALEVVSIASEQSFLRRVTEAGKILEARVASLREIVPFEQRGAGLLRALVFEQPLAEPLRDECFQSGLLLNAPRPNILRLMPQLRVSSAEIDAMIAALKSALLEVVN
jgi:acetylornithine/N-succinyldiaminopimelate aminotransferase